MQFDSYCHATKKHFFAKAVLLLTNEPTLVRENLLCYLAKTFLLPLFSSFFTPDSPS